MKNILYSSFHNYMDQTSGAAISARAVLLALAKNGWQVRTLCGSLFDNGEQDVETFCSGLKRRGLNYSVESRKLRGLGSVFEYRNVLFNDSGIDSSAIFILNRSRKESNQSFFREESDLLLYLQDRAYETFRPNVFMTYGGQFATYASAAYFKKRSVTTVFYLCNLAYKERSVFKNFDYVIVPSEFARTAYKYRLGLETLVVPPLIDEGSATVQDRDPRYLTFVNPTREKGLEFAAAIFRELAKTDAEIPILLVQGRASLLQAAKSIGRHDDLKIKIFRGSVAPKTFYRVTRLLFMPSLEEETFGRVIVEAGGNHVPTICSDRGALPETVGNGGVALHIPSHITSTYNGPIDSAVLNNWVKTIVGLWNDRELYNAYAQNAFLNAQRYNEDTVKKMTLELFEKFSGVR